jgi:hypothetical protein
VLSMLRKKCLNFTMCNFIFSVHVARARRLACKRAYTYVCVLVRAPNSNADSVRREAKEVLQGWLHGPSTLDAYHADAAHPASSQVPPK